MKRERETIRRLHVNKSARRIRFEEETEGEVTVVIEKNREARQRSV